MYALCTWSAKLTQSIWLCTNLNIASKRVVHQSMHSLPVVLLTQCTNNSRPLISFHAYCLNTGPQEAGWLGQPRLPHFWLHTNLQQCTFVPIEQFLAIRSSYNCTTWHSKKQPRKLCFKGSRLPDGHQSCIFCNDVTKYMSSLDISLPLPHPQLPTSDLLPVALKHPTIATFGWSFCQNVSTAILPTGNFLPQTQFYCNRVMVKSLHRYMYHWECKTTVCKLYPAPIEVLCLMYYTCLHHGRT